MEADSYLQHQGRREAFEEVGNGHPSVKQGTRLWGLALPESAPPRGL